MANLEVTLGTIEEPAEGHLRIRDGKVRATALTPAGDDARLIFRYLGPPTEPEPLASGEIRRQIGLKLLAQDSCNLLYVMWETAPLSAIRILHKSNPGKRRHVECGADGYRALGDPIPVPRLKPGSGEHELRVVLDGAQLTVWADGTEVFAGRVSGPVTALRGPVGLRTDNGSFELRLGVR